MPVKRHVHKYHYVNIGKRDKPHKVYACALPDCSHFVPAVQIKLVAGKKTICWKCNKETILTKNHVMRRVVKPKCYNCLTGQSELLPVEKKKEVAALDSAVDMLLKLRLG